MGPVATSQLLGPEALPGFHVTAQIRKLEPNVARWLVEDQGGPCQPGSGHQAPSPSRAWLTSLPQGQAVVTEGHQGVPHSLGQVHEVSTEHQGHG